MTRGARKLPKTAFPVFIVSPMLKPRRFSDDSTAKMDWVIGVIGPSSTPIIIRKTSSITKDATNPCMSDKTENSTQKEPRPLFCF